MYFAAFHFPTPRGFMPSKEDITFLQLESNDVSKMTIPEDAIAFRIIEGKDFPDAMNTYENRQSRMHFLGTPAQVRTRKEMEYHATTHDEMNEVVSMRQKNLVAKFEHDPQQWMYMRRGDVVVCPKTREIVYPVSPKDKCYVHYIIPPLFLEKRNKSCNEIKYSDMRALKPPKQAIGFKFIMAKSELAAKRKLNKARQFFLGNAEQVVTLENVLEYENPVMAAMMKATMEEKNVKQCFVYDRDRFAVMKQIDRVIHPNTRQVVYPVPAVDKP